MDEEEREAEEEERRVAKRRRVSADAARQPAVRVDARAIHATDGAPVPVPSSRAANADARVPQRRGTQSRPFHINLNEYLATHKPVPSAHYRGPLEPRLNNCVSTAGFSDYVPNLHALAQVAGGTMVPNRGTKLFPCGTGFLTVNNTDMVNIAGARSALLAQLACSFYRIIAARTGTVVQQESFRVTQCMSTFSLGGEVDMWRLYREHHAGTYEPRRIDSINLRSMDPKVTALVYRSGGVVILGGRTQAYVMDCIRKVAEFLSPYVVAPTSVSAVVKYNATNPQAPVAASLQTFADEIDVYLETSILRHHRRLQ